MEWILIVLGVVLIFLAKKITRFWDNFQAKRENGGENNKTNKEKNSDHSENGKFIGILFIIFILPEVVLFGTIFLLEGAEIPYFSIIEKLILLFIGMVFFLQLMILVFLIASPYIAGAFVSTVVDPKHHLFMPLFIAVEDGRAKGIMAQGGNAKRYVISKHDHGFHLQKELDGTVSEENKWRVVRRGNYSNARNFWEKRIEDRTGLAFVGIFPWRRPYHYPLNPIKVLTKDGKRVLDIAKKPEISDHVRVREFNWGAEVTVLLKDKYQVSLIFSFRLESVNPHMQLRGVDTWDESFADAIASRAIEVFGGLKLEDLNKLDEDEKGVITDKITMISDQVQPFTEKSWGLKIIETQIAKYDFSPLSDKERESLTVVEVTRRNMEGRELEYITEANGEESVVKGRARAIDSSKSGPQASRDQMLETAAKDGQQTMITGLGNSPSSEEGEIVKLLKAILAKK